MSEKRSDEMRRYIETRLDHIVAEIAKMLRESQSRNPPTIFERDPYFDLAREMGLVKCGRPVKTDLLFGNQYAISEHGRRTYHALEAEGYYARRLSGKYPDF